MESRPATTRPLQRLTALFLALLMSITILPLEVMAAEFRSAQAEKAETQGEQPTTLQTQDGEIEVEEDWNETFPYGTFAFPNYQADIGEPGAKTQEGEELPQSIEIPVYRLGGTTGVVTAWILFSPAVTTDESGEEFVYDYAASPLEDIRIEYQNPNPIAAYQTPGLPQWRREMQPGAAEVRILEQGELTEEGELTLEITPCCVSN